MNKFLRTASTRRLLGTIAGLILAIAAGTTIAIAAQGSGPVPRDEPLANAIHGALSAPQVQGISANINFTNNLINASQIQGPTDPLLSGGQGRLWVSSDGQFRVELFGDNGDPEAVVTKTSWWVSDPTTQTVYEGTIPAQGKAQANKPTASAGAIPTVARIRAELKNLAAHLNVSGAHPGDIAGQPTYTVSVSPKHSAGLLGDVQLAWDAIHGVPLRVAVYARGDSNAVLAVQATGVTYGSIDSSIFSISPPAGYKVVKVATPAGAAARSAVVRRHGRRAKKGAHPEVTGVRAVARQVPFKLVAPSRLVGLPRQSVGLLDSAGHPGALITYGQNLGGIAVIEQAETVSTARSISTGPSNGGEGPGLTLPSVTIHGATGQELDTALGTVIRFSRGGVTYTLIGSVPPVAADAAARAL